MRTILSREDKLLLRVSSQGFLSEINYVSNIIILVYRDVCKILVSIGLHDGLYLNKAAYS